MIVGEAPGADEEGRTPFLGNAGKLLDTILHEAGIARASCFITNTTPYRPAGNKIENFFHDGWTKSGARGAMKVPKPELIEGVALLEEQIKEVRPNVIIAFGNTPLWALQNRPSAKSGVGDWRGSELAIAPVLATRAQPHGHRCMVIPTYHPAAVLRTWDWRPLVVHDLRARVKKYIEHPGGVPQVPAYRFAIRPTAGQVLERLAELHERAIHSKSPIRLAVDIETGSHLLWCIGIAWSRLDAICIPFRSLESPAGYFTVEEEVLVSLALQQLLTHPNVSVVGQNFLYDAQYFAKEHGFVPRVRDDTMSMQHVLYPGFDKGLDVLSSLYCGFHQFWKGEGKEVAKPKGADQQDVGWIYNCKDAVITYECAEELETLLHSAGLYNQYLFKMEIWWRALEMMLRGVRISQETRKDLTKQLLEAVEERKAEIQFICGHPLNINSNPQMKKLLYDDLQLPPQTKRNKNGVSVSCDKKALAALARIEPLVRPLLQRIAEVRSCENSLGVVNMDLGPDLRGRSYFNTAGAETMRWTSSEDAFGSGTNYQNLSRGLEDEEIEEDELNQYNLPNVRRLFVPEPGWTIGEADQGGADAQVVASESGDETLKAILASGKKLAAESAKMMYGATAGPDGKREPYYTRAKSGGHATNYGAKPFALEKALGITKHEAEIFQRKWFQIYPGIKGWQERIFQQLSIGLLDAQGQPIPRTSRRVYNKFGYRRYYPGRVEDLLKEALAWIPQSTVAICSDLAIYATSTNFTKQIFAAEWAAQFLDPEIDLIRAELHRLRFQLLIQVHDSIVFQYPTYNEHRVLPLLKRALRIRIPYDPPLYIPWGLKTSTKSWGDAEERTWPEVEVTLPERKLVA